jgi:hypothetical protein
VSGYVIERDLCAKALGRFVAVLKVNNPKLEAVVIPVLGRVFHVVDGIHFP